MKEIIINGVNLGEFDIFEADVAEKYEKALDDVIKKAQVTQGLKTSVVIRKQCETVFEVFDSLFGEGTSKKIFGDRVNVLMCMNAFEEMVKQVNDQKEELTKITNKYSVNRAQRRSKK